MKIDPNKCVACGNCTYVCPMGAIYIDPVIKRATVNSTECVECYACFNGLSQEHLNPTMVRTMRKLFQWMRLRFDPEPDVCPTAAFAPDELSWPRVVRRAFSDPRVPHESTGVEGRGTEEVKTNDVSGRVKVGEVGFTIEFGRPGVGVWFRDMQKMCRALAEAGVSFEKKNPVTSLMSDVPTGTIREDIQNEKVLSAIVEIKVPVERTEEIIRLVWQRRSTRWSPSVWERAAMRTARTRWLLRSWRSSATNSSGPKPISAWVASPM
jgi:ferredoxin